MEALMSHALQSSSSPARQHHPQASHELMHGPAIPPSGIPSEKHILAFYDRSLRADRAVEKAIHMARASKANLYVLAIPPDNDKSGSDMASVRARMMNDLRAIARMGRRLGVAIDGNFIAAPALPDIQTVIENQHIDTVMLVHRNHADHPSPNERLLGELAAHCPVQLAMVD